MHNEEWRDIPGARGYLASSYGRVKGPRCILKPSALNSGYLGIKVAGKGTTVHAVVARSFIGEPPSERHTVNHKNGIKHDNRPENLEWMTQAENNRHSVEVLGKRIGRTPLPKAEDCRQPFALDLRSAGYRRLRIEPRAGYVAWRAVDEDSGEVIDCAALKELLHRVADHLPRMLSPRHYI